MSDYNSSSSNSKLSTSANTPSTSDSVLPSTERYSPVPETFPKEADAQLAWYQKVDKASAEDNRVQPWIQDVGDKVATKDLLAYKKHDEDDEKDLMWRGKRSDSGSTVSFAG